MKILDTFNRVFGFTQTESRVVLVLVAAFLLGIGVRFFRPMDRSEPAYDYSSLDSEFTAASAGPGLRDTTGTGISGISDQAGRTAGSTLVDINHANESELAGLPGVGPAIAKRIIAFRTENGPFRSVGELRNVKGIGPKKFERLAPFCTPGK